MWLQKPPASVAATSPATGVRALPGEDQGEGFGGERMICFGYWLEVYFVSFWPMTNSLTSFARYIVGQK
jgi:hypothetical protein